MSNQIITLGSVGEISAVTNNIMNIYAPFIEEIKKVADEKIRSTFYTPTGRKKKNIGIWDFHSLFGVNPPSVFVEANYLDEVCKMDITKNVFQKGIGFYSTYGLSGGCIEKSIRRFVTEELIALYEAPYTNYVFKVRENEKKKFVAWCNELIEKGDNERYKAAFKEFITMFSNSGPIGELGDEKAKATLSKIREIRNEVAALKNIH